MSDAAYGFSDENFCWASRTGYHLPSPCRKHRGPDQDHGWLKIRSPEPGRISIDGVAVGKWAPGTVLAYPLGRCRVSILPTSGCAR